MLRLTTTLQTQDDLAKFGAPAVREASHHVLRGPEPATLAALPGRSLNATTNFMTAEHPGWKAQFLNKTSFFVQKTVRRENRPAK